MSDDLDAMRDALYARARIEIDSVTASVPEIPLQHGVFYGNTAGFQRASRDSVAANRTDCGRGAALSGHARNCTIRIFLVKRVCPKFGV